MLALQVGCQLPSQMAFYNAPSNTLDFVALGQALEEFGRHYPEPVARLLRKMVRKEERILLSRCASAWATLDHNVHGNLLTVLEEGEFMSDEYVMPSQRSPLKKILAGG
jgi:hypothetical protein